jgi:hypothetical protein
VYHVSHFEASRNVILHTRNVSTCVGAGCGRGRGTKNKSYPRWSMLFLMYDMYKSNVRHIHDPVLSSLKMKGIRLLFYMETALNVSGSTSTHHQERKQLYLQHLVFVTPLLLPAAIVEVLELV